MWTCCDREVWTGFGQLVFNPSMNEKHRRTIAVVSSTLEDQCACKMSQWEISDSWLYTEQNGLK